MKLYASHLCVFLHKHNGLKKVAGVVNGFLALHSLFVRLQAVNVVKHKLVKSLLLAGKVQWRRRRCFFLSAYSLHFVYVLAAVLCKDSMPILSELVNPLLMRRWGTDGPRGWEGGGA